MPRPVTIPSVKSQSWASKSDRLARAFAPFATEAVEHAASGKSSQGAAEQRIRIAVAANLHDVMGLQTFVQPPLAAADPAVDDALFQPFT